MYGFQGEAQSFLADYAHGVCNNDLLVVVRN
jgi:hypothetical protein